MKRLPLAVYHLARRLGARSGGEKPIVRLRQSGRMRQDGGSRWMAFRAEQTISNYHCAFAWRARCGPARLVFVSDVLTEGGGKLDVRALGIIPLAGVKGSPEITRGERMRYLAELAWAPDAILCNADLCWREDGPDTMVVGTGSGAAVAEVALSLDSEGRIGGAFAPDRPRAVRKSFLLTPWQGHFTDYRRHDNKWLPFAGRVGWVIGGQEEVCWEGRIEHWEV